MTRGVLAAMFTAVGWLTGCATMIYGTTQSISVTSEPMGAKVWTQGQFLASIVHHVQRAEHGRLRAPRGVWDQPRVAGGVSGVGRSLWK